MAILTIILLSLILISVWVSVYQLVKQQGRILLRLDDLEQVAQNPPSQRGAERAAETDELLGTNFPSFEFADVRGRLVRLEDYRGKKVLLINWDFECGFCDAIAPDLAQAQGGLERQNIQMVMVSHGDPESNREAARIHGLRCLILLPKDDQRPRPFVQQGTPVSYLLDETGRVASALANGADQVVEFANKISAVQAHGPSPRNVNYQRKKLLGERSLAESQLERNGLKAGTTAPLFKLPDLQGNYVSLEAYRGRRVLLVFSDPQCGPCDAVAPELVRFDEEHSGDGPALLMVGRGDVEENRRKAAQFGIKFPVVLQDKWKLSREYGIFATPVAFLIDETGKIAQAVAVGRDAILALADQAEVNGGLR